VLLLAGCGGGTSSSASSATSSSASPTAAGPTVPPGPGIEATAVRQREDEPIGDQVQVRITDTGDAPFTVTSVAIDSPGFAPLAPKPVTAEYAPGRTIDLPTKFGAVDCTSGAEPAAALLTVVRPDGSTEALRAPLEASTLTLIHTEQCAVEAVLAVVDIAVVDLQDTPTGVTGTIRLTRQTGHDAVVADYLGRSVPIEVTAHLPIELGSGDDTATGRVDFTPASCDSHVLAETKKPFVFPLHVTVGKGDEVPVDLPLGDAGRARLAAMLQRLCG
jgi:hypothetical protein